MSFLLRQATRTWMIVALGAIGFLGWTSTLRVQRIETVSSFADGATLPVDPDSITGYAGGVRRLILEERGSSSYAWIAQTQEMLARGEWRVRHIDYDNAPVGRDVRTASPYRWWLALVAWMDHTLSARPIGLSVERAALWADPLLHGLLLAGTVGFVAWRFGGWAAALMAAGLAGLFPLAGVFAAGLPNDRGLALGCALWSVLLILTGVEVGGEAPDPERRRGRWFLAAGVVGGVGLWLDVTGQWPILIGLAAGGLATAWLTRERAATGTGWPWRWWALGGAAATLVGHLVEYFPDGMGGFRLNTIHPLLGMAWLGLGELLRRGTTWIRERKLARTRRDVVAMGLAVLALVLVPVVAMFTGGSGLGGAGVLTGQLTQLGGGIAAENMIAWLARDGVNGWVVASCVPLGLLGPALWFCWRDGAESPRRAAMVLALGPVVASLLFAGFQLRWWATLDVTLLGLMVAGAGNPGREPVRATVKAWWAACLLAALLPGVTRLLPAAGAAEDAFTENEVEALVERDVAHWLAARVGAAEGIVLAPPAMTTALCFHGGLRGLGTPDPENQEGFAAAVRIAGASSPDEARALMARRNVTHIVMPSWDDFLDEYARLGAGKPETRLVGLLHQWLPPRWLRPVAYQLPKVAGFERESVIIFEVVELQDNATALSRIAEYFGEMGQLEQAAAAGDALGRLYPDDPGALLARAEVAMACGEPASFAEAMKLLEPRLTEGADQAWSWDRRVNVAIVLAEGKRYDAARQQLRRCLAEIDEPRVRALSTVGLYRLQVLCKGFGEEIADSHLRELARNLLPPEMRAGL